MLELAEIYPISFLRVPPPCILPYIFFHRFSRIPDRSEKLQHMQLKVSDPVPPTYNGTI